MQRVSVVWRSAAGDTGTGGCSQGARRGARSSVLQSGRAGSPRNPPEWQAADSGCAVRQRRARAVALLVVACTLRGWFGAAAAPSSGRTHGRAECGQTHFPLRTSRGCSVRHVRTLGRRRAPSQLRPVGRGHPCPGRCALTRGALRRSACRRRSPEQRAPRPLLPASQTGAGREQPNAPPHVALRARGGAHACIVGMWGGEFGAGTRRAAGQRLWGRTASWKHNTIWAARTATLG